MRSLVGVSKPKRQMPFMLLFGLQKQEAQPVRQKFLEVGGRKAWNFYSLIVVETCLRQSTDW